jgi:hypothetical protein
MSLTVRYLDSVKLTADGTMVDRIELRFLGVRIGRVRIVLRRDGAACRSSPSQARRT